MEGWMQWIRCDDDCHLASHKSVQMHTTVHKGKRQTEEKRLPQSRQEGNWGHSLLEMCADERMGIGT